MSIVNQIKPLVIKTLEELYGQAFNENEITISGTKPEFEGDYTLVLFSFVKQLKERNRNKTSSRIVKFIATSYKI